MLLTGVVREDCNWILARPISRGSVHLHCGNVCCPLSLASSSINTSKLHQRTEHVSGAAAERERKMERSGPENRVRGSRTWKKYGGKRAEASWSGSGAVSGLNRPLTIHSKLTIDWFRKLMCIRILQSISNSNTFVFVDLCLLACRIFPVYDRHYITIWCLKTDKVLNLEEFRDSEKAVQAFIVNVYLL